MEIKPELKEKLDNILIINRTKLVESIDTVTEVGTKHMQANVAKALGVEELSDEVKDCIADMMKLTEISVHLAVASALMRIRDLKELEPEFDEALQSAKREHEQA